MARSRILRLVVTAVLLVGSGVATSGFIFGTAVSSQANPTERPSSTTINRSPNETAKLWSLDTDGYNATPTTNQSATGRLLNGTDYTWTTPPQTPQQWTRTGFRQFAVNFSTDRHKSIHPSHAALRDDELEGGGIEDAHASFVGVTPVTRVYVNDSATQTLVGSEGNVLGLVDYRAQTPTADTNESNGKTVNWTLDSHEITRVCVLQGVPEVKADCNRTGARIASGRGSHTPNLTYDALEFAGRATTVTFVAEIEARFTKRVNVRETWTEEICREVETPNGTRTECEEVRRSRWNTSVSQQTQRVTVTDALQDVTVYRHRAAVRYARFPSGEMGAVVQSSHRWAGLRLPGVGRITTPWQFYSARDTQWDRLGITTENETTLRDSSLRPARVYAYPADTSPRGLTTGDRPDFTVEAIVQGDEYTTPVEALPRRVHVNVVEDSYTTTTAIALRAPTFTPNVTVSGIVPSESTSQLNVSATTGVVDVHRSAISATVVASNYSHATVRVTLTDTTNGRPLDLRGRDGYVTVQDHRVNTNASGVVRVTVPKSNGIAVRYRPAPWWHHSSAYTSTRTRIHVESGFFTVSRQARLWTRMVAYLLPFVVTLYLLQQLPGVEAWPPWR